MITLSNVKVCNAKSVAAALQNLGITPEDYMHVVFDNNWIYCFVWDTKKLVAKRDFFEANSTDVEKFVKAYNRAKAVDTYETLQIVEANDSEAKTEANDSEAKPEANDSEAKHEANDSEAKTEANDSEVACKYTIEAFNCFPIPEGMAMPSRVLRNGEQVGRINAYGDLYMQTGNSETKVLSDYKTIENVQAWIEHNIERLDKIIDCHD